MVLLPAVVPKYLEQAEPGELVRAAGRDGPLLALVAGHHIAPGAKLLICLTPLDEQNPAPCYMAIGPQSGTGLSFGKDDVVVGDPAPEAIDPHWHGESYAPGALIVTPERTLLQVAPPRHYGYGGYVLYDIDAGTTSAEAAQPPGFVLLKWQIRLKPMPALDPPLPPLLTFAIPSRM